MQSLNFVAHRVAIPSVFCWLFCLAFLESQAQLDQAPYTKTATLYQGEGPDRNLREKYEYYYDFWTEQRVKHGRWSRFSSNGDILEEQNYEHGDKQGPHILYRSNGSIKIEEYYLAGELHGLRRCYFPDGQLRETCTYREGKKEGSCLSYRRGGSLKYTQTYKAGEKHGEQLYYRRNGEVKQRKRYRDGERIWPVKAAQS